MANLIKRRQPLGITFIGEKEIDAGTLKIETFLKTLQEKSCLKIREYALVCCARLFWRKTTKF